MLAAREKLSAAESNSKKQKNVVDSAKVYVVIVCIMFSLVLTYMCICHIVKDGPAKPLYVDGTVFSSSDRQRIVWHAMTARHLGALDMGQLVQRGGE